VIYKSINQFKVVVGLNVIPFVFSTTILLYKLDTLLLKQKKLPVLDITGFFFKIGNCCFSAKHAALRTKTAVGSEQDNVYEYDDMSFRG
jgi:hypothetical protein